ncbi:MAG: gliding-motility protein MglA [Oligoflexia bacterium]|nr:gliding-motility protein MglA [Oligoflexia bacterium]
MSFVNYHSKEINCKIVYFGPGLGGKTSNIQHVYKKTSGDLRSKLITLNTKNERTLFFDFLPLDLGEIRGFKTRFHLYTVPGQAFYEASRRLILRGVDGLIFVADSQLERMEANIESIQCLERYMEEQGMDFGRLPHVVQWNKRDLPNISSIEDLRKKLNPKNVPEFEAVATNGAGVFETLKMVSKMILLNLKGGLQ